MKQDFIDIYKVLATGDILLVRKVSCVPRFLIKKFYARGILIREVKSFNGTVMFETIDLYNVVLKEHLERGISYAKLCKKYNVNTQNLINYRHRVN